MMGENPNYWWSSLNGKLQPPSQQTYPTFLSTPPMPVPVPPPSSMLINPPYLFGSSLLVPTTNSNVLSDHHHHENLDFPVSWSQLLMTIPHLLADVGRCGVPQMFYFSWDRNTKHLRTLPHLPTSGLANDQEQQNLGGGHVGELVKQGYLDNQQSRQVYYGNKNMDHHDNEEDIQACSSSWSSQLNPVQSVGSSSLSTTTMFDFSSKINNQSHHTNQYSSQYDDTSTSGASKKPRFQSSSTQPSPMQCNDTFTSGTSKRSSRAQQSSTQTPLKVRKEKLGDRISALHQLVSPFGKTDTASVLLEATAQIRFLESQIEALTSPYMNLANSVSGGTRHQHSVVDGKRDLGSRGLCLVPVTCMDHIDTTNMTSNGAEFWTPALGGGL